MTVAPAPDVSPTTLPHDYLERVYAGILGKIIGVYLGRPIEGWTYEQIMDQLGDIEYYVHERLGVPLVVPDDDITGTFAFLRTLEEWGHSPEFSSKDVGRTWLNAIVEGRTIFWWGGYGMSTEHTAYLNLQRGIEAPHSGAAARNGWVVAEQIGAQIFIDGWAMVAPGDPVRAAQFAERAARVSHDGEAVYAAQALAAMEAQAFLTNSVPALLDTALSVIPADSVVARLIRDLRQVYASEPDWRQARTFVAAEYGYDRYPGNCHVIPNHALIILALLYGEGEFHKSMLIVNTCGWDTDCNAGNLGCLLGIMNGVAGLETGPDWRTPVADRLYLSTAEGGRGITDAAREAVWVANLGRALQGQAALRFKEGARFHFELPGSVQGFQAGRDAAGLATATLQNVLGHSTLGQRSLEIRYQGVALGRPAHVSTPTFSPVEFLNSSAPAVYDLMASPTLYSGQRVKAFMQAAQSNAGPVSVSLAFEYYGAADVTKRQCSSAQLLAPGQALTLEWTVPDVFGNPVSSIGVQIDSVDGRRAHGRVYLDALSWTGLPTLDFTSLHGGGTLWRKAWVNGVDTIEERWGEPFRLIQNRGRGLISQGTREWTDYRAEATLTAHLSTSSGLGIRVQGMQRYYALLLKPGRLQLVKAAGTEQVLAERPFEWQFGDSHHLTLEAADCRLRGWLNGRLVFDLTDTQNPLCGGGVALLIEEGMLTCDRLRVSPC